MRGQGVTFYATGEAAVQIAFPNGELACKWCWLFLQSDATLNRCRCKLTGESLPYPQHEIGQRCPLVFDKGEETI